MSNGLFDYAKIANEFQVFADYLTAKRGALSAMDKERIDEFKQLFTTNPCVNLPAIRKKAMDAGQQIIGIPIDTATQQEIKQKAPEMVAETRIETEQPSLPKSMLATARERFMPRTQTAPPNAVRQGCDSGIIGAPGEQVTFDAHGNII